MSNQAKQRFVSRAKEAAKSWFRKVISKGSRSKSTVITSGEHLPTQAAPSPSPVSPQSSVERSETSVSQTTSSPLGRFEYHHDPILGSWAEPVGSTSESDWQTTDSSASTSGSNHSKLHRSIRHSRPLPISRSRNSNASHAQVLASAPVDQVTSSIPSVDHKLGGIGGSENPALDLTDTGLEPRGTNFILSDSRLEDPFVEQPTVQGTDDRESNDAKPWDDFSEAEFPDDNNAPVYLGQGVYQFATGSQHGINELPPRAGEYYSPPDRPNSPILVEVEQSPVPALLTPRISPECAVFNATRASEGLSEAVLLAMEDLVNQASVHYHNAEVNSRRAQRAEAQLEFARNQLDEREAEIEALKERLGNPQLQTPPRPTRRESA